MTKGLNVIQAGLTVIAFALALAAAACDDSPTTPSTTTPSPSPPGTTSPTLSMIQAQIFDVSCTACHTDAGRTPAAGMNLRSGSAYANLVNVTSSGSAGAVRVIPGNPSGSYLVQKLEGAPGIVGERMPRSNAPLSSAQINMVRDWIAAGALNN